MFNGKRFVTSGIAEKVPLELQMIMWDMIDTMDEQKDYLQVFDLSEENGKQKTEDCSFARTTGIQEGVSV